MKKAYIIVSLIILCYQGGRAQSLLHSKPLDFNNGFAGAKKHDRISFHLNQSGPNSTNQYFSYDKLAKPLKGGIGVFATHKSISLDNHPYSIESNKKLDRLGVTYSPKRIVKGAVLISPSISINYSKLRTEKLQKIEEVSYLLITKEEFNYLGSSVGLLLNSKIGYVGYELKSQLGINNYHQHNFQIGYVHNISSNKNLLFDAVYKHGELVDNIWRTYNQQINAAYQYGILYIGAGLNDYKYMSALAGIKLVNLKITAAYHGLEPRNISNVEIGVQYVFDKTNDDEVLTPIRKWLINIRR